MHKGKIYFTDRDREVTRDLDLPRYIDMRSHRHRENFSARNFDASKPVAIYLVFRNVGDQDVEPVDLRIGGTIDMNGEGVGSLVESTARAVADGNDQVGAEDDTRGRPGHARSLGANVVLAEVLHSLRLPEEVFTRAVEVSARESVDVNAFVMATEIRAKCCVFVERVVGDVQGVETWRERGPVVVDFAIVRNVVPSNRVIPRRVVREEFARHRVRGVACSECHSARGKPDRKDRFPGD